MASMDGVGVPVEGRRRYKWSSGAVYYSFQEFVQFCAQQGFEKPQEDGSWSARGGALELWADGVDEAEEEEMLCRQAEEVQALPALSFEALAVGASPSVLLLRLPLGLPSPSKCGGCLRVGAHGTADCWGGLSTRSALTVEVLAAFPPSYKARIRCFSGGLLCFLVGNEVHFRGSEADDPDTTTFELLPRDFGTGRTVLTVAAKGGSIVGTFAAHTPPPELTIHHVFVVSPEESLRQLRVRACEAIQADPTLQGRRRHMQDVSEHYYGFEDVVLWAAQMYRCASESDALELAQALWKFACICEAEDQVWTVVDGMIM